MITHEIGEAAGAIWRTLDSQGELTLAKLKKEVKVKDPVFHWALGWLAREEQVEISQDKRTFRVRLK
jgi:hypothetical protein